MTPERVRDLVGLAHAARSAPLGRPGEILSFVRGLLVHGAREPDELDALLERAGIPDAAWRDAAMWVRPPVVRGDLAAGPARGVSHPARRADAPTMTPKGE